MLVVVLMILDFVVVLLLVLLLVFHLLLLNDNYPNRFPILRQTLPSMAGLTPKRVEQPTFQPLSSGKSSVLSLALTRALTAVFMLLFPVQVGDG